MAILLNKPLVTFGGRLLYSIHQKNDGKAFSLSYQDDEDSISRTAVLSFQNKDQATLYAYMLELNTKKKPKEKTLETYQFKNLYIQKWDSYQLIEYTNLHYTNLLVLDNFEKAKIYEASENPSEYIDILNDMYNK